VALFAPLPFATQRRTRMCPRQTRAAALQPRSMPGQHGQPSARQMHGQVPHTPGRGIPAKNLGKAGPPQQGEASERQAALRSGGVHVISLIAARRLGLSRTKWPNTVHDVSSL
jgi:hypothetical protein